METEASSGTQGSKSLTSDIFCMFSRTTSEREQTSDVVTKKENGAATCFEDVHAQLEKGSAFQHIGSRGDLNCDEGQKLEVEQIEEFEEETIEESLKSMENLEQ